MSDMLSFIVGESELAKRIRAFPWDKTELGPPETWPDSLKTLVSLMLAANQQMYVVWGPSRLLLYNDRYIEVLQAHHPNALGRPFLEVWKEIFDDLTPLVERAYAGIPTYQDDIMLMLKRGGQIVETHFTYSYTPVFNSNGRADGFICHCIETTEKVNAEKALREREADLARAQRIGRVGGVDIDIANGFRATRSPEYLRLHGMAKDASDEPHVGWRNRLHPDDRQRAERVFFAALESDATSYDNEYRIIRPSDGEVRWIQARGDIERDNAGKAVRFIGAHIDITEQKLTEIALRESEEKHRTLFESMDEGYLLADVIFDEAGRAIDIEYVQANPAATRMVGVDLAGKRLRNVGEYEEYWYEIWGGVAKTGKPEHMERYASREEIWYDFNVFKIEPQNAESHRVGVLFRDVTQRRRTEEALRESEELRRIALQGGGMGAWKWDTRNRTVQSDSPYDRWGMVPSTQTHSVSLYADLMDSKGKAWLETVMAKEIAPGEVFEDQVRLTSGPNAGRWLQWRGRADLDQPWIINGVSFDITEQKSAEHRLRESEERHTYLLALNDALRPLIDPEAIKDEAMRLLGEQLGVSRAQYYTADETGEYLSSSGGYTDGVPAAIGNFRLIEFGKYAYDGFHAGETQVVSDARTDPRISEAVLKSYETVGFLAFIGVPFVQRGRFLGTIAVHQTGPRQWTDSERMMVEETAERAGIAVEQARAEAALRESEERHSAIYAQAAAGFAETATDGRFIRVNPEYCRIVGRSREELLGGLTMQAITHPDDRPSNRDQFINAVSDGAPFEVRKRYIRPDGSEVWVHNSVAAIRGADGRIASLHATSTDVSRAMQAEIALRESENLLARTFDALPVGIGVIDKNGAMHRLNPQMKHYLPNAIIPSREPARVARWQAWDVKGVPIPSQEFPSARALRGEDVVPGLEMLFEDDGGIKRWTQVSSVSLRNKTGELTGAISVVVDIDALKCSEEAVRESEQRFQQFAAASSGALWIRDAETLDMEYVSPSIEKMYGVKPDAFIGDLKFWASVIVPEDRDVALEHIERARKGEAVVHEFRIQRPSDQTFRWIRDTNFPLLDDKGNVQRIGGIAEDVTEAKLADEHQGILLAELQHRVRNIMAMMRSIASRTGENADSVKNYGDLMAGRLLALARVQTLLTRAANVGVAVTSIVRDEIAAQAVHPRQYEIAGPDLMLPPKAAEVLTLAVHELATNALKYGAFSSADGHAAVTWRIIDKGGVPWLSFDWRESGVPFKSTATRRKGFGSELIEARVPYELGGHGSLEMGAEGTICHLEFPLQDGASILETDAPRRALVFGGTLDMTGEADLSGQRILVVEDDYYLATDTARALRGAGADVLGPCPTEEAAQTQIESGSPTGAVVDINLGPGPSFNLATALKRGGIPFIFITGYDNEVIPDIFDGVPRLQKPVDLKQIVNSLADALNLAHR